MVSILFKFSFHSFAFYSSLSNCSGSHDKKFFEFFVIHVTSGDRKYFAMFSKKTQNLARYNVKTACNSPNLILAFRVTFLDLSEQHNHTKSTVWCRMHFDILHMYFCLIVLLV